MCEVFHFLKTLHGWQKYSTEYEVPIKNKEFQENEEKNTLWF
jgi:hypothetical protein